MNTKEAILARLAHSGMPEHPMPALDFGREGFDDPLTAFRQSVEAAGGRVAEWAEGVPAGELLRSLGLEGRRVVSAVEEIPSAFDADAVEDARELDGIDAAVVGGVLGVAENGAVMAAAAGAAQGALLRRGVAGDPRFRATRWSPRCRMPSKTRASTAISASAVSCPARRRRPTSNRRS